MDRERWSWKVQEASPTSPFSENGALQAQLVPSYQEKALPQVWRGPRKEEGEGTW